MNKRTIFITGATGIMGFESFRLIASSPNHYDIRLLARKSKKNEKLLAPWIGVEGITVEWGDLLNADDVARAMGNADIVLHIGGMVSPEADHFPQKTMEVNIKGARNVAAAARDLQRRKDVGVVYIGSIAETGCHDEPMHWGRTGDPVLVSPYDYYGISKVLAEREIVDGGLKKWAVLRQSGILHAGLLKKGMDPITFHVPLRGVLEWATLEDSARLMERVCREDLPEQFWLRFWHIGSGEEFRLSNYEFECRILKALGCPPPEKIFQPSWFATRNFHGFFFSDSDELEKLTHFRENISADDYFRRMSKSLPAYFRLAKLAPSFVMRTVMRGVATSSPDGTLYWLKSGNAEEKVKAYFKSREDWSKIPSWESYDVSAPSKEEVKMSHGYDESKPASRLDIDDMREAAHFRGGKCLSEKMVAGDLATPLEWECGRGHRFMASPALVLLGGHWCPECLPAPWRYDEESRLNPFLAQAWHSGHDREENEIYDADSKITRP